MIWYALFDIAFNNSFSQMNGAREVILGPLTFFAHVNQDKRFALVDLLFHLVNIGLPHARFGNTRSLH